MHSQSRERLAVIQCCRSSLVLNLINSLNIKIRKKVVRTFWFLITSIIISYNNGTYFPSTLCIMESDCTPTFEVSRHPRSPDRATNSKSQHHGASLKFEGWIQRSPQSPSKLNRFFLHYIIPFLGHVFISSTDDIHRHLHPKVSCNLLKIKLYEHNIIQWSVVYWKQKWHFWNFCLSVYDHITRMGGSPGDVSEEPVT